MLNQFSRTEMLIGKQALLKLQGSKIALFGIGGVGSYVAESLVRAGVGRFVLVDSDKICLTNLNRQIHATRKTIGRYKVEAMKERMLEINPDAEIETYPVFYLPGANDGLISEDLDYVVDAVDTVTAKIAIVMRSKAVGVPVISCMGAGNKLDPSRFKVADIYKTSVCPLAKVMRREMRLRGVDSLKVVYSEEPPVKPLEDEKANVGDEHGGTSGKSVPGSISFVPSAAGLVLAGEVVRDLIAKSRGEVERPRP